ncbi:MAG TPA: elongation factor P maturation arginine rhamnosyltransferase EarP [Rheinheimera sp.]|nr:elongation factor P maturation arginine rhamnosyltransferase EarP [Rheinheimera sp.]
MANMSIRWDIFCAVIDNFGDIGICWRLSRQLVREHNINVRLWVDDLVSFARICPQIDTAATEQVVAGVTILLWSADTDWQAAGVSPVVIEALACSIPMPYQQLMAQQNNKPLWLNVEYLSAEEWVESCHALPSPQPHLPLDKYFFFPGFTSATGGLLKEATLTKTAEQFIGSAIEQQRFWQSIGVSEHEQYTQKISLFAYDHPMLESLLRCWQQGAEQTLCLVPEGLLARQLCNMYPAFVHAEGKVACLQIGNLHLRVLPFMPQDDYDKMLWACDINFVRGEDSIIRAHWATKPFVWQIYRQTEQTHLEKLSAFMQRYCADMPDEAAQALREFWLDWNTANDLTQSWQKFRAMQTQIAEYNRLWSARLTANGDLASNLVHFVEKKFIMRRNFS